MMSSATAKRRSNILELLSNLYLCKPTKEAMENWKALVFNDAHTSLSNLKDAIDKVDVYSEAELEDLLWEYTRLFVGPYKLPCPPWESVYVSPQRLMMQETCDEVRGFYNEIALTINNPDVMPDHIGAELNFLAVLYKKIESAPEKRSYYAKVAKRFLNEHLMKWIPQFTADMAEAANSLFYKTLAQVTRDFITTESHSFG